MSAAAKGGTVTGGAGQAPRLLPIGELDLSLVERVRASISQEAVEDYAGHLEALPPIRVALVDGRAVVVGGLHRVRAHERVGRAEVPCAVEPMTWAEAVRAAVADNRAHGLRMGRADKRAAIGLLLAEAGDLSSRAVAELVGCSHHTVEEVRDEAGNLPTCPVSAGEPSRRDSPPAARSATRSGPAGTRKGRDGKAYRPRPRPSREPAATANPRGPAAPEPAGPGEDRHVPAPQPDPPPVDSPALLMDFRRGVQWVARFLSSALRSPAREHRAEALDELRATLSAEELRRLAAWAEAAADARGVAPSPASAPVPAAAL